MKGRNKFEGLNVVFVIQSIVFETGLLDGMYPKVQESSFSGHLFWS